MQPEHSASDWYWWFAWRPVRAQCGRWTWWTSVWRRRQFSKSWMPYTFSYFEHYIPRGWV